MMLTIKLLLSIYDSQLKYFSWIARVCKRMAVDISHLKRKGGYKKNNRPFFSSQGIC